MAKMPQAAHQDGLSAVKSKLRIFGNKPFMRFARRFGASGQELWDAVRAEPDADLGGDVFKFRLARKDQGTSGGARLIVAIKRGERVVMMFGFEKKDMANIDAKELKGFKNLAQVYLRLSEEQMDLLVEKGELKEIKPSAAESPSKAR
jgi:hypothetical protein